MEKAIYKYNSSKKLDDLLEGYQFGLGKVCHSLFGTEGEAAIYQAVGEQFLKYLNNTLKIKFTNKDPWELYKQIIKLFTEYGFYKYAELNKMDSEKYWMLEAGQFAGNIWETQNAWDRGTPPCPLWSIILHSLYEIEHTIVIDWVRYDSEIKGYESVFHFGRINKTTVSVINNSRKKTRESLVTVCSYCKQIKDDHGNWIDYEIYFNEKVKYKFTHGICPVCLKKEFPELSANSPDLEK